MSEKIKDLNVSKTKADQVRGGTTVRLPDGVAAVERAVSGATTSVSVDGSLIKRVEENIPSPRPIE